MGYFEWIEKLSSRLISFNISYVLATLACWTIIQFNCYPMDVIPDVVLAWVERSCEILWLWHLTYWDRDEIDAILQTVSLNAFFLNENVWILIKITVMFVSKCAINNIPALIQIMDWRRPGDKALSEPMMISLTTHVWITRPQWVNIWHVKVFSTWSRLYPTLCFTHAYR